MEYLLADSMGSVTGVVDGSGGLAATASWDAFGELRSGSGVETAVSGGGFGLHGMWLDSATGLYHVRARTYDARTGRFTSRDPVRGAQPFPESFHPYSFNHGSPYVWRDPSGEKTLRQLAATLLIRAQLELVAIATPGLIFLRRLREFRDAGLTLRQAFANLAQAGRANLLKELTDLGVKHTKAAVIAIQRIGDRIVFLERGNSSAGLLHILQRHVSDFLQRGIPAHRIPDLIFKALSEGRVVAQQGSRVIYETVYAGTVQRVAIIVGNNGYVVTAYPVSL